MPKPDPLEEMLEEMSRRRLSPEDWQRLMAMGSRQGRAARMTIVDDPNSPEGRAAADYVQSHHLLPPYYQHVPEEEVAAACERLADPDLPLPEQKRLLMLLAHCPGEEALSALKSYRDRELDREMATWARLAQSECEDGILEKRTGQPVHGMTLAVSKVGRNEPCPCGSGLKFKRCCGR